jgi:hypothetical protein
LHQEGALRFTDHYDADGNLVSEIERFHRFSLTWTNPENQRSVTGYSSGHHFYDDIVFSDDGSISYRAVSVGRIAGLHVPGTREVSGLIGREVDQVVEYADGTVTVEATFLTKRTADANTDALCAYLAGP